jgi:Lantibiotic dehydratase, N terminus
MEAQADHTAPLGDTGWRVWRWALLRAGGFPATGPARFAAPAAAAAADAYLGSGADEDRDSFDKAFDEASAVQSETAHDIAGDPLFREAVTWQNPTAVDTMLDPLRAADRSGPRNSSRRQKVTGVARYWSRYAVKNDTIGFFGPICWVRVGAPDLPPAPGDPVLPAGIRAVPGPGLLRARTVGIERWVLVAYAECLAGDPRIRPWLPVKLTATLTVEGRTVLHPTRGRLPLSRAEAAVVARCDGRHAIDLAADVTGDPEAGIRTPDDAYLCLDQLAERGLVVWGIDVPLTMDDEAVVRAAVAGIDDPGPRAVARRGLDELSAGRDRVAAAAGDDVALKSALADLSAAFTRLTGRAAHQADGQMYAGRTVCFEDTVRDLDVAFGQPVLDEMAAPLGLLCTAARWLSTALAAAYARELRAIYEDLAAESGSADVRFSELIFLAQGLLYGDGPKPADEVAAAFTRHWSDLLGLDNDAREVRYVSADLAPDVERVFAAAAPGWAFARYHSPDVHVLRSDDGGTDFVLGELHAAWNAIDSEFFIRSHEQPGTLLADQARDIPPGRLMPVYPQTWPRLTPRTCAGLRHPDDWQLGFVPAPGTDPARLLPATSLVVRPTGLGADLEVVAPGGRAWPLVEVFAELFATHTVDAFKLLGSFPHSPRVWIDRMVVARETWRFRAADLGFLAVRPERERYLRVRSWAAQIGLPDRVFVKVANEVKPIYVDLTSPTYVAIMCAAIRGGVAREGGGPELGVTISEMLPTPEQAWVPDASGNRYVSELRMLVVDPRPAAWTGVPR